MPIFRRDSESDDTPETPSAYRERSTRAPSTAGPPSRTRHTVIAPGTEMIGEITGVTDVTVEGDLQGEVRIDGTVRVGPGGRVRGALEARVVEVGGKVKGDVRGRERIVLDASGELLGDLAAPRVVIHEGAFFKGEVEMTGGGARGRKGAATVAEETPPETFPKSTRGAEPSKRDTSAPTEAATETSTETWETNRRWIEERGIGRRRS
jgi:cytoskeletal protein CcmA (bactofilin family)